MRARYRTLDAMRGFAAMVVVVYHTSSLYGGPCTAAGTCRVPFGYLAVDLFFILSGFVIAHSYDRRFNEGLTATRFMILRLKRLLPIYLVGLALGLVPPVLAAIAGFGGVKQTVAAVVTNIAMLPAYPTGALPAPFPLNPPAWSLFFELWIANLFYALFHSVLRGRALAAIIVVSLLALCLVQWRYGTLDTGFLWSNMVGGLPRVIFSFFVGVALSRIRAAYTPPSFAAWMVVIVVLASFLIPVTGPFARLYELGVVAVIYPASILFGSAAIERRPAMGEYLGEISYAVYAVHFPIFIITAVLSARAGVIASPLLLVAYFGSIVLVAAFVAKADVLVRRRL